MIKTFVYAKNETNLQLVRIIFHGCCIKMSIEDGKQTHLLFPNTAYSLSQCELIDQFFPDLSIGNEKPINLANVKQFEGLIYHLETSFLENVSQDSDSNIYSFKVPSSNVFRILLTIAARCQPTKTTGVDYLLTSSTHAKNVYENYENCLYRTPIRVRCAMLLRRFVDILLNSDVTPVNPLIYETLLETLQDFLLKAEYFRSLGNISTDRNYNPSMKLRRSNRVKEVMMNMESDIDSGKSDMEVSDSEEELLPLQYDPQNSIVSSKKYHNHGRSLVHNKDILPMIGIPTLGLNSSNISSSKRKKTSNNDEGLKAFLNDIKIFGDYLVCRQLNPILNSSYNLWKLLQWTFKCADTSSKYQKMLLDSTGTYSHNIFDSYNRLIHLMFDFIIFNFTYELKSNIHLEDLNKKNFDNIELDAFYSFCQYDESNKITFRNIIENDERILLLNLIAQASPSRIDWYDRIVEYIFTGLNKNWRVDSNYEPQPCYEREKILIKHDNILTTKTFHSNNTYDDNSDSMTLRYKILVILYYRSLFYDEGSLVAIEDSVGSLNRSNLIQQASVKLMNLDYLYFKQFYLASITMHTLTTVPMIYQIRMIIELTKVILVEITKVHEIEQYFPNDENIVQGLKMYTHRNSCNILELLNNEELYLSLTEDETFLSWAEFEQAWCKVNYLLGFLLENMLNERDAGTIGTQEEEIQFVKYLFEAIESADTMKINLFNKFIVHHGLESKNNKSHIEYNFYLTKTEVQDLVANEKKQTNWVKYKNIIELKYFKYMQFL